MKRKRWTPQTEITDSLLEFREKRKWQIALRRYVLNQNGSSLYASYFGLDILNIRKWIEIQFDQEMNWDNFSKNWQFDHIIPVVYFDFAKEEDLKLCWNFTNIRAEKLQLDKNRGNRIDVLAAKTYFETLYENTQYHLCLEMVKKIKDIEISQISSNRQLENFIQENKEYLEKLSSFSPQEYVSLNKGNELNNILAEREFIKKFG
jgi:hypothetical protein